MSGKCSSHYARLLEYGAVHRPPLVLWFLNDTDFDDETNFDVYLQPGFKQDLINRQPEVDALFDQPTVEPVVSAAPQPAAYSPLGRGGFAGDVLFLRNTRQALGLHGSAPSHCPAVNGDGLARIARMMRDLTATWGGRLAPIYLPLAERYTRDQPCNSGRNAVAEIFRGLGIDVIDLADIFAGDQRPPLIGAKSYYYRADGNARIAAAVAQALGR